jgi:hypothetical protein
LVTHRFQSVDLGLKSGFIPVLVHRLGSDGMAKELARLAVNRHFAGDLGC